MDDLMRIISDNEQDRALCEEWWRKVTTDEKLLVWERIQRNYIDPVDEIMSRFAQLAFAQMCERMKREDDNGSR